jgi:hypothetical protein
MTMREYVEFRIREENAAEYLPPGTGENIGYGVRKVLVDTKDPLFGEIGRLHRAFRAKGKYFFSGREYERRYSRQELAEAELLHVWPKRVFEPAGEECGTEYDESTACPECGAGATQTSELRLDLRKAPRAVDFAETIAGERIVSQRLAECLTDAGLQGFTLTRVLHKARYEDDPVDLQEVPTGREILRNAELAGVPHPSWSFLVWVNRAENRPILDKAMAEYATQKRTKAQRVSAPVPVWYQLVVSSSPVELSPLTRAGEDPFDDSSTGRCSRGHVAGLNLLSEVTVTRTGLPEADVMETKQMIGVRRGLLRPRPVLLLSARAWKAIETTKIKGIEIEVARVS